MQSLIDGGKYPIFTPIIKEALQPHMDEDERFAYGLEIVLDSIAAGLPCAK